MFFEYEPARFFKEFFEVARREQHENPEVELKIELDKREPEVFRAIVRFCTTGEWHLCPIFVDFQESLQSELAIWEFKLPDQEQKKLADYNLMKKQERAKLDVGELEPTRIIRLESCVWDRLRQFKQNFPDWDKDYFLFSVPESDQKLMKDFQEIKLFRSEIWKQSELLVVHLKPEEEPLERFMVFLTSQPRKDYHQFDLALKLAWAQGYK